MKRMLLFFVLCCMTFVTSNVKAYSDSFQLMIDTMDVKEENKHGKKLNENIYNVYSLFVYGSPMDGYTGQRWKNVENGGWTNGLRRGEYWILGENYDGYEVHNHKFPVDIEPPTTPETWKYAIINDARDSWQDQSKYMDDFQKEYMLNSKLMRNDVEYNITVNDIGLDKVRLENYATWKTKGTVYTQRYDKSGKKWAANFMVKPMAAEAELNSFAEFPEGKIYYSPDENEVTVSINYGAEVVNLTDFARQEHVKEIKSQIFIDNNLIGEIGDSEKTKVGSHTKYMVTKSYDNEVVVLNVTVKSTLITKFKTDGALVDIKNYQVLVNFGAEQIEEQPIDENSYYHGVTDENTVTNELIPPPSIRSIKINRVVDGKDDTLLVSKKTGKEFVCAGQTITISVSIANPVDYVTMSFEGDSSIITFDELTKKFEWDEPRSRNKKTFFGSLEGFKKMYRGTVSMQQGRNKGEEIIFNYTYIVPYGTKQTLESWATLREKSQDAFSINENRLFNRINRPYQIVIKASGFGGTTTERIDLDVFERWDTLYNRNLSRYVKKDN